MGATLHEAIVVENQEHFEFPFTSKRSTELSLLLFLFCLSQIQLPSLQ